MRISDWSSDVSSSDLLADRARLVAAKSAGLAGQHGVDGHVHAVAPRGVHAAAPRGPNRMIAAPPRQKAAPNRSQRSRSEERRVWKEFFSTCRTRWSPYH